MSKPLVVCICGSMRFSGEMTSLATRYTLDGMIVVQPNVDVREGGLEVDEGAKEALDLLHLRKIDLADFVHVVNLQGYVGESTAREVAYAESLLRPIVWSETRSVVRRSPYSMTPPKIETVPKLSDESRDLLNKAREDLLRPQPAEIEPPLPTDDLL